MKLLTFIRSITGSIVKVCILILFTSLAFLSSGQGLTDTSDSRFNHYLDQYLKTNGPENASTGAIIELADKLETKKKSVHDDFAFLKILFARTHSKFLKEYADCASFTELILSMRYNCLTATALYALLLDRFGYDYRIIETNYHIFLLVTTSKGGVLLETTDPLNGFVADKKSIEERIREYRSGDSPQVSGRPDHYPFSFDLFREVGLTEMTGLLYFNLAVEAFNRGKIDESIGFLQSASMYYTSERIEEFTRVILMAVSQSNLDDRAKSFYVNKVLLLRKV